MPNIQKALRQDEFNSLVSSEIINPYVRNLIGKEATEINSIEELDSLHFFPMAYISNLSDEEKNTLLAKFKSCAEKQDYRPFIQEVEARVPGVSNRTIDGYAKEYENFAQLEGKATLGSLSHLDLMDSLKSGGSVIIRLRDRVRGIQNFRSMANSRSEGFTANQLSRILSGLYYLNDEFVSKADDFVRFMEVRGLFTNKNEVTRHYNMEVLNNMGIDTTAIQNLINSEEYNDVAFNNKTNFNDYGIDDIEKISSLDEKITSIVALPYIRNMLNLPEGHMVAGFDENGTRRNEYVNNFKNFNDLNRRELNALEELLKRNDDDNMQTIQTRLRNYSKIVNDVVDRVYDAHGKDIARVNTEVNPEAEKANMKGLLANMLARDGAFAKSSEQDFLETAVGICVNNYQNLYHFIPKQSKTSMRIKEVGIDGKALEIARCYVTLNNKTYSIDVTGFEKDKNNNIVFKDEAQLNEVKRKLTSLYGVSFENVKKEDFKLGYNPVAEALMNILEGREQDSNKQVANEVASEVEASQDNIDVSANENVQQGSIPTESSVFVGSEIYMKALIEARKRVRQYILEGKVEFITDEPSNSKENVVESSVNSSENESETNKEADAEIIVEPNELDEKLFHDQIKKRLESQSEKQENEPDVEAQKKLGEASRSELTGLNLEDFNNLIKPNIEVKNENQEEEVQKTEKNVLVDEVSIVESPEMQHKEVKDDAPVTIGDASMDWYNQERQREIQKNSNTFATIGSQSSTRKVNSTVKNKTERVTSQKQGLYYTDERGREIPVKIVEGGKIVVDTTRKYIGANHVFYFVNRKNERKFNKVFNEIKETNNINEYGTTNQNTDLDRPREEEREL